MRAIDLAQHPASHSNQSDAPRRPEFSGHAGQEGRKDQCASKAPGPLDIAVAAGDRSQLLPCKTIYVNFVAMGQLLSLMQLISHDYMLV